MAWELFCNKAFHEIVGTCPIHLYKLSHEIVEKSKGLPLAIKAIAGLLSTKNNIVDEWRKLLTSLSSQLESNEHLTSITKILLLSYNDLPYDLKSCFLYFGIFKQDNSIRSGRLIRQWIAEGFVMSKKDKTLEEVAEEYMAELISRNLVQVSDVYFDGKPRTCRIHDLLQEIILNKMEDLSFCQVLSGNDSNIKGLIRRMSIINACAITTNFKLLKVLDFDDAPNLDHFPEDIGCLFHFKYLSVRGTRVRLLPKSIGKLENLGTLDLKESLVLQLPIEIRRLYKLRHLLACHTDWNESYHIDKQKGVKEEKGIGRLQSLQKLYFIEVNVVGVDTFEELSKLTELRKLGIKKLRSADGRISCDCIQIMNYLESLDVATISEDEMLDLESMLENLVRIRISWSKLEDDLVKALKNLPNLLDIGFSSNAYYGEELKFEEGAFPKLKVLRVRSSSKLRWLIIEEGALCNLEEFHIGPRLQLKELSCGFQHLRNLEEVSFREMPANFLMSHNFQTLQSITGVEIRFSYKIVEHIMMVLEIIRGK
ncbi:NB-ARC domain, LRR domain containing protein [Parasponia andersonii]|uniref:NB-ARC domain, LRR domain containing protein n=1 Tax=Parasponia andersonii TaxID=3476 RepID=A0A2P5AQ58_PARAD|nr:NB-ARC domain, LRR domain containing protein [Parasponia andersonii]